MCLSHSFIFVYIGFPSYKKLLTFSFDNKGSHQVLVHRILNLKCIVKCLCVAPWMELLSIWGRILITFL